MLSRGGSSLTHALTVFLQLGVTSVISSYDMNKCCSFDVCQPNY